MALLRFLLIMPLQAFLPNLCHCQVRMADMQVPLMKLKTPTQKILPLFYKRTETVEVGPSYRFRQFLQGAGMAQLEGSSLTYYFAPVNFQYQYHWLVSTSWAIS